jgi:hypothetical protein
MSENKKKSIKKQKPNTKPDTKPKPKPKSKQNPSQSPSPSPSPELDEAEINNVLMSIGKKTKNPDIKTLTKNYVNKIKSKTDDDNESIKSTNTSLDSS